MNACGGRISKTFLLEKMIGNIVKAASVPVSRYFILGIFQTAQHYRLRTKGKGEEVGEGHGWS